MRHILFLLAFFLFGVFPIIVSSQIIQNETFFEYDRNTFGDWKDENRNCINTRHEVLIRDALQYQLDEQGCKVVSGLWIDFYTGEYLDDVSLIDIDHVVPLKEIWDSGGSAYSKTMLRTMFNDIDNLVVTHRKINRSKGSWEPHEWHRFDELSNYCGFLSKWTNFKMKYYLTFDQTEFDFLVENEC